MAWNDTRPATNLIPHSREGSRMQQGEQATARPSALDLAGFAQEFLRRNADVLTMVECVPHLVRTTVLVDSDVQGDGTVLAG